MDSTWTVSALNRYIRTALETDYRLQDLMIEGEISNVSRPASGHIYFTLKDSLAQLRCVMWKTAAVRLVYRPRDGDHVQVHGTIGVYEASGQYQLYADSIRVAGAGDLFRQFTELKARLEAEGLFANARPVPSRPARVALVTSPTAAALRDMLNVFRRRWPALDVVLCPTPVQGDGSPIHIVAAIGAAIRQQPDVIIVARGGGSIEDLWAFNDEFVVRAIAASPIPVISGVGHEIDFTLADFAADLRAPTPSAAAELATPDRAERLYEVQGLTQRLADATLGRLREARWRLAQRTAELRGLSPRADLANSRQRVDDVALRGHTALTHRLALQHQQVNSLSQRLESLNPLAVLNRGYAIVTRAGTNDVVKAGDVDFGDALDIRVSDGQFDVIVSAGKREVTKTQTKK
jgi:exodeoxyribonuclease VII large subunit